MVLFVADAVPLADASRSWLREIATAVPESRVVRAEGLHLTLRYLGPTDCQDPADLVAELRWLVQDAGPFPVRLEGIGAFPSLGRPRAIWVGVTEGRSELVRLGRLLAPGEPAIKPHCTLARVGGKITPTSRDRLRELERVGLAPLEFRCASVGLYESRTDAYGPAQYRCLGELLQSGSASEGTAPEGIE